MEAPIAVQLISKEGDRRRPFEPLYGIMPGMQVRIRRDATGSLSPFIRPEEGDIITVSAIFSPPIVSVHDDDIHGIYDFATIMLAPTKHGNKNVATETLFDSRFFELAEDDGCFHMLSLAPAHNEEEDEEEDEEEWE